MNVRRGNVQHQSTRWIITALFVLICMGLGVNYSKGRLHSLTVLTYGKPE